MKNTDKRHYLYDSIISTHEVQCDFCENSSILEGTDEFGAVHTFYDEGWRSPRGYKTYCPDCANKKLKKI